MWTCVSTLVPRFSRNPPTFWKFAITADVLPASAAWAASARLAPTFAAFWCSTKTAKMSPKSIPARIKPMPPSKRRRRALSGANASSTGKEASERERGRKTAIVMFFAAASQYPKVKNPAAVILRGRILSHSDAQLLEAIFQSQLNLARIVYCARRSIQRVRRTLTQTRRDSRTAVSCGVERAEIGRAIDGVEETNVQGVGEVKHLADQLETSFLLE